ncbi:MAG: ROK family protein [Clostridium celatum]|nr:ROK family protein [Clostridium celatum]
MYICIDIGGTAIKVAIANIEGNLFENDTLPVYHEKEKLMNTIVNYIENMKLNYDIKGVCISAPGAVDSKSGIIYGISAIQCIHGFSWKEELGRRVNLRVSIENDTNCAALAETFNGKAKGLKDVLFLVCGTGIGGSIVKDGKIHNGKNLHGGEFGFMIMEEKDGKFINFSRYASTMSFVRKAIEHYNDDTWNGERVFEAAGKGDKFCIDIIDRFYLNLAKGIYNLQYVYDPEIILIGGGISKRDDFIYNINKKLDYLMEAIEDSTIRPVISACHYKNDANLVGALVNHINC